MSKYKLGIVAVVPFWSQSDNLNADSNYVYLKVVLPEMERQTEDTLFFVFFPNPRYGSDRWVYKPDGLQTDRIRFYSWPYETAMHSSVVGFDSNRYGQFDKGFGPGIYWLHQVEMGAFLQGGYDRVYHSVGRPTLIAQHHYIIHKSLPYPYYALFPRQWYQIGGSIASDQIVYNSKHAKHMADEAFADYLNDKSLQGLNEKSQVLPFGLLTGDEPRAPLADGTTPPAILYNHRFENYKQPRKTFEVLNELREKYQFKIYATQTIGQDTGGNKFLSIDESIFEAKREDYLERISFPAINTMNSIHETFCISILDSLAVGHLVVLPNALTFPELVPPDYPFLFKNQGEQKEMLDNILSTWPEHYNRWHTVVIDHVRKTFNVKKYVTNYLKLMYDVEMESLSTVPKKQTQRSMDKFLANVQSGVIYDSHDLRKNFKSLSGLGAQSFPHRYLMRWLIHRENFHPTWNGESICLVRD